MVYETYSGYVSYKLVYGIRNIGLKYTEYDHDDKKYGPVDANYVHDKLKFMIWVFYYKIYCTFCYLFFFVVCGLL